MIYKQYGKTKKRVSILGFGGSRFKKEDYEKDFEYPVSIIREASKLGVNFFDTAPHYCDGKSESIFGEAFKKMPNNFYISTKSRVIEDPTADAVRRRIETSLKRLCINKINFFDMWAISSFDEYRTIMKKDGPYKGALKAREEGLIDHITFSSRLPSKDIIRIINDDVFEGVTLSYNIINFPSSESALVAADKAGMGIAIMNPLASGIIPKYQDYFSFMLENGSESVVQAAIRFVMSAQGVTTVLSGVSDINHLYENIKQCNKFRKIINKEKDSIKERINEKLDSLCNCCCLCVSRCPKNIYVHMYMEVYNLKLIQDDIHVVERKLAEKKNMPIYRESALSHLCDGCRECEKYCPKKLDIAKRIKFISENIELDSL